MVMMNKRLMTRVSADEVKRDFPALLRRVATGETLVIVQAGRAVAEIHPVIAHSKMPRPCGLCAGEFVVPDDFDAPLPESVLQEFEGK